jgi:hypothetical protein
MEQSISPFSGLSRPGKGHVFPPSRVAGDAGKGSMFGSIASCRSGKPAARIQSRAKPLNVMKYRRSSEEAEAGNYRVPHRIPGALEEIVAAIEKQDQYSLPPDTACRRPPP